MLKINKQIVKILNRRGETLYCILTSPAPGTSAKKDVIVFSQVGVVTKTGMGDHLRILSDNLAGEGYTTLRFDQSGTGDSAGEISSGISIPQFFRHVQKSFFKNDTLAIIDWILNNFSDYRLFLFGECGGCLSSILACAERSNRIAGLALLAMPVLLYPLGSDNHKEIRDFDAQIIFKSYLEKIFNPRAWGRFLSGRSDIKFIKHFLQSVFKRYCHKILNRVRMRKAEYLPDHERFNWKFWEAFQTVVKAGITTIFLMPELDNETFEFNAEFKEKVIDKVAAYSNCCSIAYLPVTDHSIMFQESRKHLLQQILNWMNRVTGDR